MPNLGQHQFRVASVAWIICDSISKPLNKEGILTACLLHDMGNIIKFDLNYFPQFLEPKGLEYWQQIKNEYIEKYGTNEHVATKKICEELGIGKLEIDYVDAIGFSHLKDTFEDGSLEKMICSYADHRVGPHGVLSVEERLADGKIRYSGRTDKHMNTWDWDVLAQALRGIEQKIFVYSSIQPESITNELVEKHVLEIKHIAVAKK